VWEWLVRRVEGLTERVNRGTNGREERNVGIKERKRGRKIGVFNP